MEGKFLHGTHEFTQILTRVWGTPAVPLRRGVPVIFRGINPDYFVASGTLEPIRSVHYTDPDP